MKSEEHRKQKIVFIEVGGSHDECLYSQLHASFREYHVILITTSSVIKRNQIFNSVTDEIIELPDKLDKRELLTRVKAEYKRLKNEGLEILVFNTAQGWLVKRFCISALFDKVKFVGIAHDVLKFKNSFGQRLINLKIKKYFFLADFLKNQVTTIKKKETFYPIRFDGVLEKKQSDKISIVVIGGVENIKKDLTGFFNLISEQNLDNIHITFLGKSNFDLEEVRSFKAKLIELRLTDNVTIFDHFVEASEMNKVLGTANLILPLSHPNTESGEIYFQTKISGSMNIALGYKIPLLLHESLISITELNDAAIYYSFENFMDKVMDVNSHKNAMQKMNANITYQSNWQEERFIAFLKS